MVSAKSVGYPLSAARLLVRSAPSGRYATHRYGASGFGGIGKVGSAVKHRQNGRRPRLFAVRIRAWQAIAVAVAAIGAASFMSIAPAAAQPTADLNPTSGPPGTPV